jgi:hypothetical protein
VSVGEVDKIIPIAASALKAIEFLPSGTVKTCPGLSHGMLTSNAAILNADLLEFVTSDCLQWVSPRAGTAERLHLGRAAAPAVAALPTLVPAGESPPL